MALREDLVASAVTFLQDPSVTASPLESRIAFLQSKNLTQEEVDAALARAGGEQAPKYPTSYAPQHAGRQPQPTYDGYQQHQWQQPQQPAVPERDWRDWFIMATVVGGVGYGLYFMAKRYVYPMIAPPATPQLERDKQAIDDSFERAFSLLDQLAKDTEVLKTSEKSRTERLDTALAEVENVIDGLKTASRRREDESRRIGDELRELKDLIPKAMETQKEATDVRLKELNTELKSLKTLMGQRMNPPTTSGTSPYSRNVATPSVSNPASANIASSAESVVPNPASVSNGVGTEPTASLQGRSASPFNTGVAPARAAIPAWQMTATNKSSSSVNTSNPGGELQEAAGGS